MAWLRRFAACGARPADGGFTWKADPQASRGFGPFKVEWIAPGWQRLEMPVLAVFGSEDDTWGLPEPHRSERLAWVPKLEQAVVDGAGHFVHMEKPAETAAFLRAFLAEDGS